MPENEEPKRTGGSEFLSMVEDHVELASLEWQYEKQQGARRFRAVFVGIVLALTAWVYFQVGIVLSLKVLWGFSLLRACAILTPLYMALAVLYLWRGARRDSRVGEPFQGSREEFRKNLQWMRKLFS